MGSRNVFLQLQLIPRLRPRLRQPARGQLQHGVRAQAQGNAAAAHVGANLQNLALLVEEHNVDRKLHEEGVHALARHDPQPLARREPGVLQQTLAALRAAIGDIGAVGQHGPASGIGGPEFSQDFSLSEPGRYNQGMEHAEKDLLEKATFGAGCFWGVEAAFRRLAGVKSTQVGYAGGKFDHPTYEQVCTDRTGHAEAVEVTFDPKVISYHDLLEVFWDNHNPTTLNRQGPDVGNQYRSAIFFHSPEQEAEAKASRDAAQARFSRPIVTEIVPAQTFWRAEEYHQQYLEKRGLSHCHI